MSDCINGCLTDTFNYINDVCGQLTFALYTLFTFFARVNWLTDGWTEPTFTLLFLTYCPTHTTSTATTTSHISFHFHIHYCFRRATQVSFSSFFTFTTDGKLSTVNLCAWVCACVCVATSVFVVSYCSRAPEKQMMTLTAVKLSLFDFIIINSGQASLIIE